MGYLVHLKAMIVDALKETFDSEYPEADFRNLRVSVEYPVAKQDYPGIWVDYDDTDTLKRAGVDHFEDVLIPMSEDLFARYTRWRFQGAITLTCVALTSLERDRLFDSLIDMVAFGPEDPAMHQFRVKVEDNDLVAANINFDTIQARGNAAAPGTPWGTEEMIYERSVGLDIVGEFVLDRVTGDMTPLSKILITGIDEVAGGEPLVIETPAADPTGWH
jgi:hypothetical protein